MRRRLKKLPLIEFKISIRPFEQTSLNATNRHCHAQRTQTQALARGTHRLHRCAVH